MPLPSMGSLLLWSCMISTVDQLESNKHALPLQCALTHLGKLLLTAGLALPLMVPPIRELFPLFPRLI